MSTSPTALIADTEPSFSSTLFEHSPMGILVLDSDLRFIRANRAFQELLGYTEAELLDKSIFDITHPDDLDESRRVAERLNTPNFKLSRLRKRYLRKDGSEVWVQVTSSPVPRAEASRPAMVTIVEDITEAHQREVELNRFHQILEQTSDLVACMTLEGKVLYANAAFRALFPNLRLEELHPRYVHPDHIARHIADTAIPSALANGRWSGESAILAPDGSIKPVSQVIVAHRNARGELEYTSTIMRDLSDRAKMEQLIEAQRSAQIAASKMAALGEMASGIAHEINNPLAVILGAAGRIEIELNSPDPSREQLVRSVGMIQRTGQRISRIVRGLRFFARDVTRDGFENASLRTILDDTLAFCSERFTDHGVRIEVTVAPENLTLSCRPTQISQVLLNLLNNAFDATSQTPDSWVRVQATGDANTIQITVTDSGAGIPTGLREKIMQPFFTTKEVGKGTGLGLSISKGIIEEHGGRLTLTPDLPNTQFEITLPRKRP